MNKLMNKDNSRQLTIFIFSFFLIGKIFSSPEEILNKYSSIKTKYNSIFMNISEFKYDESIYLTINSENKCDEYLEYLFLDNIDDINDKLEFKYTAKPQFKLKRDLIGTNRYTSLFYTIIKRSDILFNLKENIKGNLLYLEFNCRGEVEIINTHKGYENEGLVLLFYFSLVLLGIFIYIVIKSMISSYIIVKNKLYKIRTNWQVKNNMDNNINNPGYINQNQTNIDSPNERIVYVEVSQNLYNMKDDNAQNNISSNKKNNDSFQYYNGNDNYIQNYNIYNMQREFQEFPQMQNLECPQGPNILNSTKNKIELQII